MNSVSHLIVNYDTDYLLLSKSNKISLCTSVLLYVFRAIDSAEMSDMFKTLLGWSGKTCIKFRKDLQTSGVIQKDLKFVIYAKLCKAQAPKIELSESDTRLVSALSKSTNKSALALKAKCKSYYLTGNVPRSIYVFDKTLADVILILRKDFSNKFAAKKFTFLTQSGQLDKEDLKQEFMQYAIYAIYRAYPEIESQLHMNNIAIQAIHNRGINIIKEQTSLSKNRLTKNADGTYSGTVLSLNGDLSDLVFAFESGRGSGGSMVQCSSLMSGLEGYAVDGESPTNVDRQRDLRLFVEHLMDSLPEKPKEFVSLLMGIHNDAFSEFIGGPNEYLVDTMTRLEYATKAKEFFNLSDSTAQSFFRTLRTKLSHYS